MSERQIEGTGLALLVLLAATLFAGLAWRFPIPLPGSGEAPVRSAISSGNAPGNRGPARQLFIPAGWRAEQVAAVLADASLAEGDRFLELVRDRQSAAAALGSNWSEVESLEGYLFPGTYEVPSVASEEAIIAAMTGRFKAQFTREMRQRADRLGLSPHEVVTLASVVERESSRYSESPVIAGVFLSRLKAGIPLQADPTVVYAIESVDEAATESSLLWQRQLSSEDLSFDSPYNTYLYGGLPRGPIASPSLQAIEAVLYAADVDYLYFVAKGDGSHAFARTLSEHQTNVELYRPSAWSPGAGQEGAFGAESDLELLVQEILRPLDGHVGVAINHLVTGEAAYVNARDYFTTASLYKLFVMAAAFHMRDQGYILFDERLSIPEATAAEDPQSVRARLGSRPTIGHAVEEMIALSSNAAGVSLLHELGTEEVTRIAREHGMEDTWLSESRIISTPRDVAHLLELLASGRAVNSEASADMLALLHRQEIEGWLPEHLPEGTSVAHKPGSLHYVRHDAGILYTSGGPVAIVIMTEGVRSSMAEETIARIGRLVFEYFESYAPAVHKMAAEDHPSCPANPFRPKAAGALTGKTVVLDPAHGGVNIGATFSFSDGFKLMEKDVTMDIALRVKDLLSQEGATVYMTRCRDVPLAVMERAAFANSVDADLFLSIELGESEDPAVNGTQVYSFSREGNILANYMLGFYEVLPGLWETLNADLSLPRLGLQEQDFDAQEFAAFVFSRAPSALSTSVFLTNPSEADALREDAGGVTRRQEIARGHLVGIRNYFTNFGDID